MVTDNKLIEIFNDCSIIDGLLALPKYTLSDEEFRTIKKHITNQGGFWKTGLGFQFQINDSAIVLNNLRNGNFENKFKKFQFYFTTNEALNYIDGLFDIEPRRYNHAFEPSAGQGHICDWLKSKYDKILIDCCELMPENRNILINKGYNLVGDDFLTTKLEEEKYDFIVANPPFNNGQDMVHIKRMYDICANHGTIISFLSNSWKENDNSSTTEFKRWLKEDVVHYDHHPVSRKYFRGNKSSADCTVMLINKIL